MDKINGGALLQFVRISRGRHKQRRHRLRRAERRRWPSSPRGRPCRCWWNRRFTFRVRGPLQAGEVARFAVVALGTAGLGDLVLLTLSSLFPALMASGALGANVLKLGAILGALALSFFGMRCWVFIGRRLSSGLPAKARGLPSSSWEDRASKDDPVHESMPVVSLKQPMEVYP